jgi:putative ABC transport system permease protein
MDQLGQDLRYAARQLRRRPAFTAVALAMLALGIGANTAIFSAVYAVLLRPLPFPEPHRVLQIYESRVEKGWNRASVAPGNFWDFRDMSRAFEDLGAYRFTSASLTGMEYPEQLSVGRVTSGFFSRVLGTAPILGRDFLPGEDQPGAESRIALLGNRFWQSRFEASPGVVGTRITLDGESIAVVGVLPPGRPWLDNADVYLPMMRDPADTRTSFELAVIGRLKPGMTPEGGRSDLETVARRLEEAYPQELAGIGVSVRPSGEWIADPQTRLALWVLLGAVGFLLMIACMNLANLLLGSGLGLLLAWWGLDALTALAPSRIPGLGDVAINGWVLAFTLGAGVLTGVATGMVPSLQASREGAALDLRTGGHSIAGARGPKRLRGALVSGEVALSLILLVGAGLLVRSFGTLMGAERGFETGVDPVSWTPRDLRYLSTRGG